MIELGPFSTGLLTGLREGVEAALIVSIVLAYLVRTGSGASAPLVWFGAGAAVTVSIAVGLVLWFTVGELRSPYEQLFEAATLLIAAGVVTWMLFWMRRQSRGMSGELRASIDRVLSRGGAWGLAVLAFTAIVREGIETSLFLVGQVTAASAGTDDAAPAVLLGALVGLVGAAALGVLFYTGSRRINLGAFFRWTGIALVFVAAGLLAGAVHELIEIRAITIGTFAAYDVSAILPHESGAGSFLHAMIGYSSAPEVTTLVVHLSYLVGVLFLYLRPARPRASGEARPSRGTVQA